MHTIESQQNPFAYYEKELRKITSGQVAPSEIKDVILTAHEKGCNVSNQFCCILLYLFMQDTY